MNIPQKIKHGMALAFFASAYAEQADECGQALSGEIMDQLPQEIDKAALYAVDTLVSDLVNGFNYLEPGLRNGGKLTRIWYNVLELWRNADDKGNKELTPELFGHYCAMQAMGHGVGLESFGDTVRDFVTVPYCEFGSHSLERDYF